MLPKDKTRIVVISEKRNAHYLAWMAKLFGWSVSKTGDAALRIGMAKLTWAHDILHKRWDNASDADKAEAIHWLCAAGVIPEGTFDKLEKEIGIEAERKKWREAAKTESEIRAKHQKAGH